MERQGRGSLIGKFTPFEPPVKRDSQTTKPLGLEYNPFMSAHDLRRSRLKKKWKQIRDIREDAPILYLSGVFKSLTFPRIDACETRDDDAASIDLKPQRYTRDGMVRSASFLSLFVLLTESTNRIDSLDLG